MDPRNISIESYGYALPQERIAVHPLGQRDACRLLVSDGNVITDHVFCELPALLPQNSLLVYNDTRVINARLRFTKTTGAAIEIFCLEPEQPADYEQAFACQDRCRWQCLIGNSKKWKEGSLSVTVSTTQGDATLTATRVAGAANEDKSQTVEFAWDNKALSFSDIISAIGEIPIPPYLNRDSEDCDSSDYQTVYSHYEGSVAAPTAGLHFTDRLLEDIDRRGIERAEVTLHVGAGTFRPVKSDTIGGHAMHSEYIAVTRKLIDRLIHAKQQQRPVVAVGTTSVRTLESLYHIGRMIIRGNWQGELPQWVAYTADTDQPDTIEALKAVARYLDTTGGDTLIGRTRIIIAPGYQYRVVDAMVTNFHQPQSTLLLLVSAFIGEGWRQVYTHALDCGYRFLSYGDACLFYKGNKQP